MDQAEELKNTFLEEYSSAKMLYKLDKIKSAVILISKSLFALCDYIIYKKYGKLPKNHSERFRILEVRERAIFAEVDLVWSKYTETYSKPSGEESYKMLYEAIKRIIKNEKSCEGIEKSVEE